MFPLKLLLLNIILLAFVFTHSQSKSSFESILNDIGEIQTYNQDSALKLIISIKPQVIEANDPFALMKLTNFEGLDYYYRSNYDSASIKYFEALKIAVSTQDLLHKGIIFNNLGSLHFDLSQYDEAQTYFDSAYQIMTQIQNVKWLSKVTGNAAGVKFMKGEFDESISLLEESINYGLAAQSYISVAGAYGNLAMVLTSMDRKQEALEIFNKGLSMLDSVGDKRGVCIVQQKLGELLLSIGENSQAESVLNSNLKLAYQIEHFESIMNTHLALANYFETIDLKDSAITHIKKYIQWKDSVFNDKNFKTINELEEKYKSAQKQNEIQRLEIEKEKELAKIEAKELENYLLWSLLLVIAVILAFVIIQFLNKRKSNLVLSQKNWIIEQNLAEKEVLMREIHHRVKNNFQMISGVLMIQASNSENDDAKNALLDARNRIQSMSLTHQTLYQSNSITNIELSSFLDSLIRELVISHGNDQVEVTTNFCQISIPVDMAINIGLILTEGIINAYKYGVADGGKITISTALEDGLLILLEDNGAGFELDLNIRSFGIKMMKSLTHKLSGQITWINNNGTLIKLEIPLK
ncbi:MAG: tetratricopeptide repeat protein [Flavobacteriales bacterium]|nr:tetratricopeptide repeat protein [Flavobacteriales bacterium]